MDFGAWEGVAWHDISRAHVDAWAADLPHYAPGGGESLASMLQRVQAEVGESGGVRVTPNAKNTAFLVDVFEFS